MARGKIAWLAGKPRPYLGHTCVFSFSPFCYFLYGKESPLCVCCFTNTHIYVHASNATYISLYKYNI